MNGRLSRAQLIDLALVRYFQPQDAGRIDAALEAFHPDARFTIYPDGTCWQGHAAMRAMYAAVFARHGRIDRRVQTIIADPAAQRIAASFEVTFTPASGPARHMRNVNIWMVEAGRFRSAEVYTAGSGFLPAQDGAMMPTQSGQ